MVDTSADGVCTCRKWQHQAAKSSQSCGDHWWPLQTDAEETQAAQVWRAGEWSPVSLFDCVWVCASCVKLCLYCVFAVIVGGDACISVAVESLKKKKDYIHTCLNRCNYDYYYHIFRFCFCVFLLAYSGLWNVYICIQSYISQYSFSTCSYYMSCSIFPLKYTLVCVFDDIKTHVYCTWDFVYCTWDFVYCVFSLLYTLIVSKNNICLTGLARVGYNGYHFTGYPESMPGQ